MASPYDSNLLASAPKATKAQLQDGYNADLLVEKPSSTPPSSAIDPEVTNYHSTAIQREVAARPLTNKKIPFYRTKKGIIIISVLVIVIVIAAVVGGAVGGTRNKSKTPASMASSLTGVPSPTNSNPVGVGGGISVSPVTVPTPSTTQQSGPG